MDYDHTDLHQKLKNKRGKILDEMWNFTQDYLDSSLKDYMECAEELKIIEELETIEEFKSFLEELESIQNELNDLYIDYLSITCQNNLKKEKIIALREKFHDEIRTSEIVEVVKCSKNYARQFYLIDGIVEQKDKRTRIGNKDKDLILKRDNYACVVCSCTESLEVHHIMPLRGSTIKELDEECNLVSLCKDCHYLAHSGNYYKGLAYNDIEDFWKWTKNTERTLIWLILKDIEGIGVKISENIYNKFKSVEELKRADVRSLTRVPLVSKSLALRIKLKLDHINSQIDS